MAVHVLTSLSASPGVSTTALAWARLSDRPTLIVEADPVGGSPLLSIAWQGQQAHDRSILELANHPPREYVTRIWETALPLPNGAEQWLLPTTGWPEQARSLQPVWGPLGAALAQISVESGTDVLVDIGRLGSAEGASGLMDQADTVLLFVDATLAALNTAAVGIEGLRQRLDGTGSSQRLAIVPLLGNEKGASHRPYGAREIATLLTPTEVLPAVTRDAKAATALTPRTKGPYVRSVRAVAKAANAHAERSAAYLDI